MRIRYLVEIVFVFAIIFVAIGCSSAPSVTLGPNPKKPEVYLKVTVDSIPSGSNVYGLRPDMKTLGPKLGSTPCTLLIGLAEPYYSDGQRYQNDNGLQVFGPANARKSEFDGVRGGRDLLIDLALHDTSKDRWVFLKNFSVGFLEDYNHNPWPPNAFTMTIPFWTNTPNQAIATPLNQTIAGGLPSGPGTPSGNGNKGYQQARQEYEDALSAYNIALKELDNAKNARALSNMSFGTLMSGSPGNKALGLLTQGMSHLSLQDTERNLQIARERLNRAQTRLDTMNWK